MNASATDDGPAAGATHRRYGGASADERRAQRRERLIEAGYEVFGRLGYLNTTMRLVCAQAHLSERYFYESFESLDDLFKAVHRHVAGRFTQVVALKLSTMPGADGVTLTRACLEAFFQMIKDDPRVGQVMLTDAVTTGMTSPLYMGTHAAAYADLLRDRLLAAYPEMRQDLVIDYITAGFGGVIVQVGDLWMQRKFDTPIPVLVDHIIYAWRGLHLWLAESAAAKRQASAAAS